MCAAGKQIFLFLIYLFLYRGDRFNIFLSVKPASVHFHVQIHYHDQCCDSIKGSVFIWRQKKKKTPLLLPVIVQQIVPFKPFFIFGIFISDDLMIV